LHSSSSGRVQRREREDRAAKEKQGSGWHEQIRDYSERCRVILFYRNNKNNREITEKIISRNAIKAQKVFL
jgi:hypothetical protein